METVNPEETTPQSPHERVNEGSVNSKIYLLIIIGVLASVGPFTTDFYLPSLPEITTFFGTTASMTQLSLTFCMLGLGIGQLFIGPLSDRYGRKKPLIITVAAFAASTIACVFSWSVWAFIAFRFIQGMAGAGGIVISRSIVVDLYRGKELAKFFTLLSVVQGLAPILAPVLGGVLLRFTDWRGIFAVLVVIEVILLFALFPFRESLPRKKWKMGKISGSFTSFLPILRNKRFVFYVLVQSLAMGVMFAYIASSPFIFQETYGLSPSAYGLCFGINALGIMLGNLVVTKFSGIERALRAGTMAFVAVGACTAAALMLGMHFIVVEIAFFMFLFCLGMILPTTTTLALDLERESSGSTSAILGFFTFLAGGIASPLTGLGNMLYSTGIIILVCCACVALFTHKALKRES